MNDNSTSDQTTDKPNRLPGCSFISDKEMKRQGRGTVEEKVTSVEGVEMIELKWYDNKPVHLVSSFAGAYPTSTVQRWDKKEKKIFKFNVRMQS